MITGQIRLFEKIPINFVLWMMMFSACWISYMLRVNMSVNIIAMVDRPASTTDHPHRNNSSGVCSMDQHTVNASLEEFEVLNSVRKANEGGALDVKWSSPRGRSLLHNSVKCLLTLFLNISNAVWQCLMAPPYLVLSGCDAHEHQNKSHRETFRSHTTLLRYGYLEQHVNETTFAWDSSAQGLILGSYFWGYLATIFGGPIAERWGPKRVVTISAIGSAVLTGLCVPAAYIHWGLVVVIRVILGLLASCVYPSLHCLIASWIPPSGKGKFISSLMGGNVGTVVTWSMSGFVIDKYGWHIAFYIPAVVTLLWSFVWIYVVYDTPSDHPRLSDNERKRITEALGGAVSKEKLHPPLKSIATSLPYISMVVLHFGNMWGLYFIMTAAPKFMSTVLNFNLKAAGVLSALPYLARTFAAFCFGAIGDCISKRQLLKTTAIRKWFTIFSHVLPGLMLIALMFTGCNRMLIVSLMTLSMGWNGAATLTNLANHQDLAPNFAGTLYGFANFVGSASGFVSPLIVAHYTRESNGFEDWKPVFFIGAAVYILSALFFALFGSGELQPWNFPKTKPKAETNGCESVAVGKHAKPC